MKKSRSIKNILRLCAWSTVLACGLAAQADTFYQTVDMGNSGIYWLDTYWTNSSVTVATNPAAGHDYINALIGGSPDTRTLPAGSVFPGDSLTMRNSGRLQLKNGTSPTSVNLILEDGTFIVNGGGGTAVLDGTLTGFGDVALNTASASRTIQLGSLIKPDNTFSSIEITGAGTVNVTDSANTFTGVWNVAAGTLTGSGLGDPSEIVVSGSLDFDSDFSSTSTFLNMSTLGSTLLLDQNVQVDTATIWVGADAVPLKAGTYSGADLLLSNATAFAGSIAINELTVMTTQEDTVPEPGITVYQTTNMVVGIDWNDPTYWDNGEAPVATNDYINNNNAGYTGTNIWATWNTRTPTSGSETFAGKSLTLTNGAVFNIKGNGPWTINNFDVWAGSKIANGGAYSGGIAGKLNLKGTGSITMDTGTANRNTTISSILTADPSITNIIINISQTMITNTAEQATGAGYAINGISAIDNVFDGLWTVESGYLKGQDFGTGNFLVTDLGLLDFDYSYYNNTADLTIEANPTNSTMSGMLLLDENVLLGSATIWGVSLAEDSYTGAELKAHPTYGAAIHPDSDDVAILAVGASASLPTYQIANNSSSVTWDSTNSWDNGQIPSGGFDYVNNTPNMATRNPNVGGAVFGGKSLTLANGAQLKLQHNQSVTISNLTMYAGTQLRTVNNTSLNGDLTLAGTGGIICDFEKTTRSLTVNSLVTAADTVTNITITASQAVVTGDVSGFIFTNPSNTFSGTWIIENGYLKGEGLGQGSFLIEENGFLELTHEYINTNAFLTIEVNPTNSAVGGQILLEQNMTINKATLWGEELAAGTYDIIELATHPVYGQAFASGSTGSITVTFVPVIPEIGELAYSFSTSELIVGWAEGSSYATYTLQSKDNLTIGTWSNLIENIPGIDGAMSITNEIYDDPVMFYRVIGN